MTDPNVVWLRQSLADINAAYRTQDMASSVYTSELAARVRDFQRDHRLLIDGMAGRQTQIIINTLLADGSVPRLSSTAADL
jgi:general secretion pathway protein A